MISAYLRELYQVPGVAKTVGFDQIKTHYYASHRMINPTGVVPLGPKRDFNQSHQIQLINYLADEVHNTAFGLLNKLTTLSHITYSYGANS